MLQAVTRHPERWPHGRSGPRDAGRGGAPACRRPRSLLAAACLALLHAGAALSLAPGVGAQSAEPTGDDADDRYARTAHRAVERFERQRRFLLPVTRGDPGRCDVRVGSYCYWYDENEDPGPPEPARIARARQRLLILLDSLAARHPGDGWLAGQRLLYGLGDGVAAVRTELLIPGERPGWLERAWSRLRGAAPRAPVRLRWTDVTTGGAERARTVFIRLDMLPEGSYTMTLTVTAPDGRTVTARRALHVTR